MHGNTESLSSQTIEAIAQLKARIAELETRNSDLEDRCSSLKEESSSFEERLSEADDKIEELEKEINSPEELVQEYLDRGNVTCRLRLNNEPLDSVYLLRFELEHSGDFEFSCDELDKDADEHEKTTTKENEDTQKEYDEEIVKLNNRIRALEEAVEMLSHTTTNPRVQEILHHVENQMASEEDPAPIGGA